MDGLDIGAIIKTLKDGGENSPFKDFNLSDEQLKELSKAMDTETSKLLESELSKSEEQRKKEESDKKAEEGRKKKEEEEKKQREEERKELESKSEFGKLLSLKDDEVKESKAKYEELADSAKKAEAELEIFREAQREQNKATLEELKEGLEESEFASIEKSLEGLTPTKATEQLEAYKVLAGVSGKNKFEKKVPKKTGDENSGSIADLIKSHYEEK